ncbi:MAG: LytTR family DNA-binding domain-containing protein [Lachnospiraceae bacterium]|nr:LytTR family DNA-binding domain-containing protein [Lachnospiraceae bacterium]MDE7272779.1 LytTR family DNA-binding domain-containing protein [Lachnospiraceae bacterium]
MYLIALCDDEAAELDKTEQMLRNYEERHTKAAFAIERFERADELLNQVRANNYLPDFILMDIYMPEKLGIEAAHDLRDMGSGGKIIFLTTSREHALDAFGVEASQYLVKPVSEKILFPVLDKLLGDMEAARRKYLLLRIDGKIQRVAVSDIVYCEAQGKSQHLYLSNGTQYGLRRTMAEIYEMLACYREFSRVGVAYIVNLEHVDSINAQEVEMDNGKKIYLPRGSYQPLRERYFSYYCEDNEVL